MRKIPDAELELMMVIWDSEQPVSRMDIETKMENGRGCRAKYHSVTARTFRKEGLSAQGKAGATSTITMHKWRRLPI